MIISKFAFDQVNAQKIKFQKLRGAGGFEIRGLELTKVDYKESRNCEYEYYQNMNISKHL